MKKLTLTILTLATLLLASCDTKKIEVLSDQDKATIKTEVEVVINQIIENSEAGNFEKATEPYLNSPEFIAISNGVVADYTGYIKSNKEYFSAVAHQKYNETNILFTYIDKNNVIMTYIGTGHATFKDKQQFKIDPFAATLVFKKIDDSWKVTYSNEFATITPIAEDSTNTK